MKPAAAARKSVSPPRPVRASYNFDGYARLRRKIPPLEHALRAKIGRVVDGPAMGEIGPRRQPIAPNTEEELHREENPKEPGFGQVRRDVAHRKPANDEIDAPERQHHRAPGMKAPPEQGHAEQPGE